MQIAISAGEALQRREVPLVYIPINRIASSREKLRLGSIATLRSIAASICGVLGGPRRVLNPATAFDCNRTLSEFVSTSGIHSETPMLRISSLLRCAVRRDSCCLGRVPKRVAEFRCSGDHVGFVLEEDSEMVRVRLRQLAGHFSWNARAGSLRYALVIPQPCSFWRLRN